MQSNGKEVSFGLWLLFTSLRHSKAFLNALVYLRPRFSRSREKHPSMSFVQALTLADMEDHQLGANKMRSTIKPGGQALVEDDDEVDDKSELVAVVEDKAA
jgi:hypothetical protein